jgi:predicted  nucleic acid-binding Zn-ribbon protein
MPRRNKEKNALQRVDTQLARKKRRYRQVQAHLGESEALRKARAEHKAAQDELVHQRAILRKREFEATSVAEKLRSNEELLYSGRIKNPKELSDLQKEAEYLTRRKAELEDRQIEAMITVEQVTTRAAVANEAYVVTEAAWRSEDAELSQEYDALKRELTQLLARRKALLKHVSAKDLDEYDAIRRLRKGLAVVAVKEGMCQVCNVQVPQRDLDRAGNTDEFYYCSGCERILYVPEAPGT